MPFTPPLVSPSRRHPGGGIENEIFSPVQSNVSRGNSCGGAGGAGVDLHAVAAKTTRAKQAGSAAYRQRRSNLIRSCTGMLTFAWTLNPLNVAQPTGDLPRRGPAYPVGDPAPNSSHNTPVHTRPVSVSSQRRRVAAHLFLLRCALALWEIIRN